MSNNLIYIKETPNICNNWQIHISICQMSIEGSYKEPCNINVSEEYK